MSAHCAIKILPTLVEPVKVSLRTSSLAVNTPPTSSAQEVGSTLKTPCGMPACSANSANASADNGVSGAGFTIMLQPAARAGAALRVIIALGKFHGVIAATTPTGCLITNNRRFSLSCGIISPYARLPSSANHSMKLAP